MRGVLSRIRPMRRLSDVSEQRTISRVEVLIHGAEVRGTDTEIPHILLVLAMRPLDGRRLSRQHRSAEIPLSS